MKDITTPVPPEEMRKIVQKCLEKAALINYSQLTEYAQIEGFSLNTFQGSTVRILFYFGWPCHADCLDMKIQNTCQCLQWLQHKNVH